MVYFCICRLKKTADVGGKEEVEDSNKSQQTVTIVDHGHGHLNPLSWDNLPQSLRDKINTSDVPPLKPGKLSV